MSNMTKEDVVEMLRENFEEVERHTRHLLNMKVRHHATDGSNREDIYADVLREFISDKYEIAQNVFIIDSDGKISKEVDIAIYEKTYIPHIFKKRSLKVLPIEGVFAVVQAKSNIKNAKIPDLKEWTNSIIKLTNTCGAYSGSIFNRISKKLTVDREYKPLTILMGFDDRKNKEKSSDKNLQDIFDYTLLFTRENDIKNKKQPSNEKSQDTPGNALLFTREKVRVIENRKSVNEKLNGVWDEENEEERNAWFYTPEVKQQDLLYFYFQLNKYLLTINNPHPFPLAEYSNLLYGKNVEKK